MRAAYDDILLIEQILSNDSLTHIAAFHAQQAIEKSLKAIIEEKEIEIPKIHKLATLIAKAGLESEEFIDDELIKLLDALYVDSRYPGEFGLLPNGKPSPEEAREFFHFARNVYEEVKKILSKNS